MDINDATKGAFGLAGAAGVGLFAGRYARGKDERLMTEQIHGDLRHLGAEGHLPPVQPLFALTPRRPVNGLLCYATGTLATGFVVWLATVIITAAVLAGWDDPDMNPSEQFTAPLFFGFVIGTIALIPGLLVGSWLWAREVRKRIREATATTYRTYWAERQRGAQALANGQTNAHQVATVLAGLIPEGDLRAS